MPWDRAPAGSHLRRRPDPARPLRGPPQPGRPAHRAVPRHHAQHPDRVGGDGHRHRVAPGHRAGAGGRHRRHPQEPRRRRAGDEVDKVKRSEAGMIVDPITMRPEQRISDALEVMANYKISGVPVTDREGHLVGILTNRDLRFETRLERRIDELMTRENLVTVPESAPRSSRPRRSSTATASRSCWWWTTAGNLKGLITVKDIQKMMQYPNACKDELGRLRVAAAVGASGDYLERAQALVEAKVDVIVLDSSHAHSRGVLDAVEQLRDALLRDPHHRRQRRHHRGGARPARARRRRHQDRHRPGLDLHHAHRHRRRRAADHRDPRVQPRRRRARRAGDRRRRHQVLGRRHQVRRRRRPLDHDRLALRRHRGEPRRDHPLPGPHLQGVPRHGLALGDAEGQRRALLPGRAAPASRSWCRRGSRAWSPTRAASTRWWRSSPAACVRAWASPAAPASRTCATACRSCASPPPGHRESHAHDVVITKEAPNYWVER